MTYRSFISVASIGVTFGASTCANQENSYGRKSVPPTKRSLRLFGTPHLQSHVRILLLVELPNRNWKKFERNYTDQYNNKNQN